MKNNPYCEVGFIVSWPGPTAWQIYLGLFNDNSSTEFRGKEEIGAETCLDTEQKFSISYAALQVIGGEEFQQTTELNTNEKFNELRSAHSEYLS